MDLKDNKSIENLIAYGSTRNIITLVLAMFCTSSLSKGFLVGGRPMIESSSFESIVYLILFALLFHVCLQKLEIRRMVVSTLFGFFMAFFTYVGAEFNFFKTITRPNFEKIMVYVSLSLVISAVFYLLYYCIDRILEKQNSNEIHLKGKSIFLIMWGGIIITWIPAFLAVFPGIYSYDASLQLLETFGGQGLNSHHPVIHTLILSACVKCGELLFDSYNYGVAIYSIVQALSLSAVFAYIGTIMVKYNINKVVLCVSMGFCALNPINQIWAFVTTKDVFFTVFFLLVISFVFQFCMDEEFFNKSNSILFIIYALAMCLFRNQGLYVLVFSVPFFVIFSKKNRRNYVISVLIAFVILKIITGPVYDVIGISAGSIREALSVPIQQLARVHSLNKEFYSEEDLELMYNIIPQANWDSYIPEISDPVKGGFQDEYFSDHKLDFIKLWVETGFGNLKLYVESFLYGAYGYWYVDASPRWMTYIWFDGFFMEPQYNILNIQRDSKFVLYEEYLRNISYNVSFEKIPVISVVLNQGFPFWVMVFVMAYGILRKKYAAVMPACSFVLGLWGTILLGPCICVRYAYPLIAAIPLMITILFAKKQ